MKRDRLAQAMRNNVRRDWYKISNKADDGPVEVLIYGEIGDSWWVDSIPAAQFVRDLADIDADAAIDFHIHSPGGDVFDGLAIATAIRTHKGRTTAYVDGLAASAASYIAVAADEVVMALGSELMIHDAWGFAMGNAEDMTKMATDLAHVSGNIASLYAAKAGGTTEDWRAAMLAETWYTADEAVSAGLADRVDKGKQLDDQTRNTFDLSIFAHAGRKAAPPPTRATHKPPAEPAEPITPTEGDDTMSDTLTSGLRERLGINAEAELDETGLLAALDEALTEQTESTPELPKGTVAISQAVLDELTAKAARGDQARTEQLDNQRNQLVSAALTDGRIKPAEADDWRAQLTAADGTVNQVAAKILASLAKGSAVPVVEAGYTGGPDASTDDDNYSKLFGQEA